MTGQYAAGAARDEGSMAVEVVVLAPLVLLFMLLLASMGRLVQVHGQVEGAARDAARAASVERTGAAADAAAETAAKLNLGNRCTNARLTTRTAGTFTPGGLLTYRVQCVFPLPGASAVGLPTVKTMSANAVTPLDTFRRSG